MNQDFPGAGMELTHILVVHDLDHARTFYRDVLGASVYREYGGTSCVLQFAGSWLLLVTGGGPTADKLAVTFEPPPLPNRVSHCHDDPRPRLPGSVCPADAARGRVLDSHPTTGAAKSGVSFAIPTGTYSRSVKRGSGIAQRTPTGWPPTAGGVTQTANREGPPQRSLPIS